MNEVGLTNVLIKVHSRMFGLPERERERVREKPVNFCTRKWLDRISSFFFLKHSLTKILHSAVPSLVLMGTITQFGVKYYSLK